MLKSNIIEDSNSPITSPLIIVDYDNKISRPIVDYREVNKWIQDQEYPTPTFDQIIEQLKKCNIFSVFDLTKSFFNFKINKKCRYITAFICEEGVYQFKRLPMGLKISPKVLQRFVNEIIKDYRWKCMNAYYDDLLTNSIGFNQHLIDVKIFFELIRKHNLKLKPSKCQLFRDKISF